MVSDLRIIIAEYLETKEGILYTEIDPNEIIAVKRRFDAVGIIQDKMSVNK